MCLGLGAWVSCRGQGRANRAILLVGCGVQQMHPGGAALAAQHLTPGPRFTIPSTQHKHSVETNKTQPLPSPHKRTKHLVFKHNLAATTLRPLDESVLERRLDLLRIG